MWYPVLQGSLGLIRCDLQREHNTAVTLLQAVLYPKQMESSYTAMLHSLLRLLILIMRGKIVFASISGKFLTFLVSRAGYI